MRTGREERRSLMCMTRRRQDPTEAQVSLECHFIAGRGVLAACAVARLCRREGFSSVPISKVPDTVVSHPSGGPEDGATPSGTAWASDVAAKRSGASRLETCIVNMSKWDAR